MGIISVPGIRYPVSMDSVAGLLLLPNGKLGIKTFVMGSGFFSTIIKEEQIEALRQNIHHVPVELQQELLAVKPGPMICVLQDVADRMTIDEFDAVLFHEQAHLELGHLNPEVVSQEQGMLSVDAADSVRITCNVRHEIEADGYAAGVTSVDAIKRGLFSAIRATAETLAEFTVRQGKMKSGEFDVRGHIRAHVDNDIFRQRIQALEAFGK